MTFTTNQFITRMINLYYKIWVDAIEFERKNHGDSRGLLFYTLVPMSFIQGLNLFGIFLLLSSLNVKFDPFLEIDIFRGELLDKVFTSVLTLFMPFIILNYILIFHKKRYERLIERYGNKRKGNKRIGLYYGMYFIISVLLIFAPMILFKWVL